jgi:DNA recombination protein RmuC
MAAEMLFAVLIPLALVAGLAAGWVAHRQLARSATDVLLHRAQLDVARLEPQVARLAEVEGRLEGLRGELRDAQAARAALQARLEEQRRVLGELEARFKDAFRALAGDALRMNSQAFLDLARSTMSEFQAGASADLEGRRKAIDQVVAPVREALEKFDAAVRAVESHRIEAYSSLREQVAALKDGQRQLHTETASLVKALRSPTSRGRWGEYQLRRVVELAGMVENCDFTEQAHVEGEDGWLRPDVVVHLPGDKSTVIDAKVPLMAYLNAIEAQDEEARRGFLREHARQVRTHVAQLGSKAYWDPLASSPDFVVMYVPMESAFSAALEEDPGLIDYAVDCRVIPCGPMTLLTHLKAAAYGWRQERIAESAEEISELGKQLYDRLGTLADHFADVGRHLGKATESFNSAVGSLEHRVLVSARRFKDLGAASGEELREVSALDVLPRAVPTLPGIPE